MITFQTIALDRLREHPHNPRTHFDPAKLKELADSIRELGVLNPLLVRPSTDDAFEILAGARRYRAAKLAGVAEVPIVVRVLDDVAAAELMVVDNLQREDVHPLEEATGYHDLMKMGKRDVAWIAARIGRSVKYVYDRMKLLELSKESQKLFRDGEIDAGHAILLARLTPAQQKQVIEDDRNGLFDEAFFSFTPEEDEALPAKEKDRLARKARTVRELQDYINDHFRFDPTKADTFLFPETTTTVKRAAEQREKVVHITHDLHIQDEARDKSIRTIVPTSWERADGKHGSKTCDHSVIGVVVCGPGRGESFRVCLAKEKCKTHWAEWQKRRAQAAKATGSSQQTSQQERWKREEQQREAENRRRNAEKARWDKATPAILQAVAERVKTMPTKATGLLADLILRELRLSTSELKAAGTYLSRGSRPEDLIRFAAFLVLYNDATGWGGMNSFPKLGKALGLDVKKLVDAAVPPIEQKPEKPAAKANGKKKKAA